MSCNGHMRFFPLILAILSTSIPLRAADTIPLTDTTIIPGKRVGPITSDSTLASLKSLLGESQVKPDKFPGAEGETIDGIKLFADSDRELHVFFEEAAAEEDKAEGKDKTKTKAKTNGAEKPVSAIRLIGKAWKFSHGLKLGLTLTEVEKINGKPFTMSGFGWDYGGYANFEGGKLEGVASIRFSPGSKDVPESLSGDRPIPSTSKKLRTLNPIVSDITVYYR